MKNRWKASVKNEDTEINEVDMLEKKATSKSKKIGIAMGVVGALLVTAGVAPMFMDGENLQGDITQEEAMDPLVALLSGGSQSTPATVTPLGDAVVTPDLSATNTPKATVQPVVSGILAPKATPNATVKSTVKPTVKATAAASLSEVDKILAEEGAAVPENKNTGTKDTMGSAFGEAETLHSAAGLSNTSSSQNQPTPKTTVQTGNNSVLFIGFLFLIISAMASATSFIRRK